MNKFIESIIKKYYISEGINFNDLDDSDSNDELSMHIFNNKYKQDFIDIVNELRNIGTTQPVLFKQYVNKLKYYNKMFKKYLYHCYKPENNADLPGIIMHIGFQLIGDIDWIDLSDITNKTQQSLIYSIHRRYSINMKKVFNIYQTYGDFVDLGVSVKWATKNIGAKKISDSGLLFQWGTIKGYKFNNGKHKFTYGVDKNFNVNIPASNSGMLYGVAEDYSDTKLKEIDDAAYQYTNGVQRMPIQHELIELIENSVIIKMSASACYIFISKINNNFLIIPMGGRYYGEYDEYADEDSANIWCSQAHHIVNDGAEAKYAFYMYISDECAIFSQDRCFGMNIRGIKNE